MDLVADVNHIELNYLIGILTCLGWIVYVWVWHKL